MIVKTQLVTNAMYDEFRMAAGHREPLVKGAHPEHPVLGVSRTDAEAYCVWAGTRLPTYAELPEELIPYCFWTADNDGGLAILRGGSWVGRIFPSYRNVDCGFRCVSK